jgi:hypothetical protein
MDDLKINEEVGKILNYLKGLNLKPEEKIAALHSTITVIEQVRVQQAVMESMARAFMPIDRKTIN